MAQATRMLETEKKRLVGYKQTNKDVKKLATLQQAW